MALTPYPTLEAGVEGARNLVEIVKEGKIVQEKELFGQSVWNTQGFLQSVLLGQLPQASPELLQAEFGELRDVAAPFAEADAELPQAVPIWAMLLLKVLYAILKEILG